MAAEHATVMVLKVNLECYRCFLKVKKVLGNLPQIGDQVFDWKQNEVRISVICCDPDKIRRKLFSKAGKAIIKVDFKLPAPKSAEKPKSTDKPKSAEKTKELDKKVELVQPQKPKSNTDKPKTDEKPKKADPSKTPEPMVSPVPEPLKMPAPVNGYPLQVYPVAAHCGQCYDGGPCHHGGYARPGPPPNGPFGYEYGYGGGKAVDVNRLDYFSEENPSGCSIM